MNINSGTPWKVPLSFAWEKEKKNLISKRTNLDKEKENKGKRLIFPLMTQIFLNMYGLTWASEEIKRYLKLIIKFLPGEQPIRFPASRLATASLALPKADSTFEVKCYDPQNIF
jgi:hypothetical protein